MPDLDTSNAVTARIFGTAYFKGVSADPTRFKKWVDMSNKLFGDAEDPHMGFQLQQCGFLDALLMSFESDPREDYGPDVDNVYIAGQSYEFLLGDCWILFTYEVLRTFRGSNQFSTLPQSMQANLLEVFRFVTLVRMPIAKHEAAKTNKIFHVPIRIMNDDLGTVGWRVYDKSQKTMVDILRRPLADALLHCAEQAVPPDEFKAISQGGSRELITIIKT